MKFLIVLALAFVATQAAFTGSLVQHAQPLIQDLRIQSLARSSVEANFQTQLGEAIGAHVNNILTQLEGAVEHVQNVAAIISNSVANAIQQGVSAGQQAIQQGQAVIANLLSSIIGAITGGSKNGRELSPVLIAIIQQLGTNPAVLNIIHSTQLYQCLIGKGLQIEYQHLADLYYSGELLAAAQAAREPLRQCIEEQGLDAIHAAVAPYVPAIVGLLDSLNIRDIVHDTIIAIIGQDLYDQYVLPVLNAKGFFGNAITAITQGAQQLGQYIASVAQNAIQTLQEKIEAIKEMAAQFVAQGLQTAQNLTFQAAQNLISFLEPYKEDLGILYNQVVDQLTSIYSGLVLPF